MAARDDRKNVKKMKKLTDSKIYPWIVVALLWVVALLNYMDRQMLSTMRSSMQNDIPELRDSAFLAAHRDSLKVLLPVVAPADSAYGKGVSALAAGQIDGTLIIAGGANFPDTPAAEGGAKCFYNEIYTLEEGASEGTWALAGSLPQPAAYGAAFSTADAIIIAGGANATGSLSDVLKLTITRDACPHDSDGQAGLQVAVTELTPLPTAVEQAGAAQYGDMLYIAGGLSYNEASPGVYACNYGVGGEWSMIAELPEPFVQPIAAATDKYLYVWGGFDPVQRVAADYGFRYDFARNEWCRIEGLPDGGTAVGASVAQDKDGTVWLAGGVNRDIFNAALNQPAEDNAEYLSHPADYYRFRRELYTFDPSTEKWSAAGQCNAAARAGAALVLCSDNLVIINGEEKPGIRSTENYSIDYNNDWAVNFGRLMAIFLWIYGFMSPVAGAIADRISRKWLIVASLGVWSTVTLLMGYSDTFRQIYWLRALMGVSEALYIPAALSLIADYFTGSARSLAIGIHMTGLYLGQAVGGFGATVAEAFSWRTTFHSFGLVGIIYAVVLIIFLYEKRREPSAQLAGQAGKQQAPKADKESVFRSFAMIFSNIAFWTILFFFASSSLPGWATKNWLPTLFADSLGLPMSQAGPIATITIAISSFIGVMIGGPLSDRWVRRNLRGRIYTSATGLALMIPALIFIGIGHSVFAAVGAGLCFGVGYGMFDANNMPILCQFVPARQRASAYGLMNMTGVFAGAIVTDVLGKWVNDGNLGFGFTLMAAIIGAALLMQLLVLRPKTDNME